jgi:hypothetical protein
MMQADAVMYDIINVLQDMRIESEALHWLVPPQAQGS